jgi:hypothetical protein
MIDKNTPFTTVEFEISEDKVVTNDTVKVSVTVSAMIDGSTITNENLASAVKAILNKFIEGDWAFSNPTRQFDTGIEKATYAAHIRIPADQNYDLNSRASAQNAKGIQITNIVPDVSIPIYQTRKAESELRATILKRAQEEAAILSDVYKGQLTIGSIVFGEQAAPYSNAKSLRAGSAYAASASFGDESPAIGNSERIAMSATVKLVAINKQIDGL